MYDMFYSGWVLSRFTHITSLKVNVGLPDSCGTFLQTSLHQRTNLTSLIVPDVLHMDRLTSQAVIFDSGLMKLTNLTELDVYDYSYLSNASITRLSNLTKLRLFEGRTNLNFNGLQKLTNLTHLEIKYPNIPCTGLSHLTNLTTLKLRRACQYFSIDDQELIQLKKLSNFAIGDVTSKDVMRWGERLTNKGLQRMSNLTTLEVLNRGEISNRGVQSLTNLVQLRLGNSKISDEGLSRMRKLSTLSFFSSDPFKNPYLNLGDFNFSDNHFSSITKLDIDKAFNIDYYSFYSNYGLHNKLKSLSLRENSAIPNAVLKCFINLSELDLTNCTAIQDKGIMNLTNLASLILSKNTHISNYGLRNLSCLTHLNISCNDHITNDGITHLTNLEFLNCSGAYKSTSPITDEGIKNLTKLSTLLCVFGNITNEGIQNLLHLTSLDILSCNMKVTPDAIMKLTNLRRLGCPCTFLTPWQVQQMRNLKDYCYVDFKTRKENLHAYSESEHETLESESEVNNSDDSDNNSIIGSHDDYDSGYDSNDYGHISC